MGMGIANTTGGVALSLTKYTSSTNSVDEVHLREGFPGRRIEQPTVLVIGVYILRTFRNLALVYILESGSLSVDADLWSPPCAAPIVASFSRLFNHRRSSTIRG